MKLKIPFKSIFNAFRLFDINIVRSKTLLFHFEATFKKFSGKLLLSRDLSFSIFRPGTVLLSSQLQLRVRFRL